MSAPLVVNTRDGVCWTRRTVTSGGIALYAPESVRTCPDFVMATEAELAEHGIVGSADVLPVPPGPQRGVLDRARDAVDARLSKDALRHVLQNVIAHAAGLETRVTELEAELYTEQAHGRTLLEQRNAHAAELLKLRPRVAELEAAPVLVCRECAAPVRWVENTNGGWWNHTGRASDGHGVVPKPAEDPCHPCGCPKRFDRHADGCPTVAGAEGGDAR